MRISTAARLKVEGCLEEAESVDPVGLLVSVLTMSASNLREDKEGTYVVLSDILVSMDINAAFWFLWNRTLAKRNCMQYFRSMNRCCEECISQRSYVRTQYSEICSTFSHSDMPFVSAVSASMVFVVSSIRMAAYRSRSRASSLGQSLLDCMATSRQPRPVAMSL